MTVAVKNPLHINEGIIKGVKQEVAFQALLKIDLLNRKIMFICPFPKEGLGGKMTVQIRWSYFLVVTHMIIFTDDSSS